MKNLKRNMTALSIVVATAVTMALGNNSFATDSTSSPLYLGLKGKGNGRNTGYYSTLTETSASKPVIKIVKYNAAGTVEDASSAIYCLKDGIGFGSEGSSGSVVPYTQYFDIKNPSAIDSTYKAALPQDTAAYNKMVWILDNLSIPTDSDSVTRLLTNAGTTKSDFMNGDVKTMTDDEFADVIESIQQTAIWYYTNPTGEYHPTSTNTLRVAATNGGVATELASKYYSNIVDDPITLVYQYLINGASSAVTNGYTYSNNASTSPITFVKDSATITTSGSNYLIGPYQVNETGSNYTLTTTVSNGTTTLDNVTLVGADKTTALVGSTTTDKIKSNLGKNFYISIPNTTSATSIKIDVSAQYQQTTETYWSTAANLVNANQPVVIIEKKEQTYTANDTKALTKPEFDLALRKFIISINGTAPTKSREPVYTQSDLKALATKTATLDNGTTLTKAHTKDPLEVSTGDKVVYKIRVYNEGEIAGRAAEITDYLPTGLELVPASESTINSTYGWTVDATNSKLVKSSYLKDTTINLFDSAPTSGTYSIDYKEVQIECKVTAITESTDNFLKNVAEISKATDESGATQTDRDSITNNLTDSQRNNYAPGTSENGKGYEDDDDYENLKLPGKYFDLSLRKFITGINDTELKTNGTYDRAPVVDVTPLKDGTSTTAKYAHTKNPVSVSAGDTVIYTIRVYNEGKIDGYADEIADHLPEELEFVNDEFNAGYGWTIDSTDSTQRTIKTTKLSKQNDVENVIKAFDGTTLQYKDIKIKCKVKATAPTLKQITNIAEITKSSNDSNIADRDNKKTATIPSDSDLPGYKGIESNKTDLSDKDYYYAGQEDDDDFEKVILEKFDLALRKFITGVNDTEVTNRIPQVDTSKFGTIVNGKEVTTMTYNHTKEPVRVCQNDIVTYTIRVYNEGTQDGYAAEIKDDVPDGLIFLADNATNKTYRWVMYDENGTITTDSSKAKTITTDYLSQSQEKTAGTNLLKAYNSKTMTTPAYLDVKVAFKVSEPNTSDRIITNKAQISKDSNSEGKDVNDIDSTPDKWNEGEDDQDIEKVYVKYFDLALRKWVSQVILIEDGVQKEKDTGHYAEQEPEPVVKVEVNKKRIENTIIKFRYQIRITNEGEIAGYATEISDYIPDGLKFNQADNPKWKEASGKIVTDQLKDKLLQPGEQAVVEVTLTWINGEENMKLMNNVAEISADKNDSNTHDIDSTPNNKKEGEDDIDDAPVILTTVTGSAPTYIALIAGTLFILGAGAFAIKKYVL